MARRPFESRIQDAVYGLDMGGGLRIFQIAASVLLLFVVILWFTATQFKGLRDAEAMDAAQIGRNLMQKRGFVTYCIRPASIGRLEQADPAAGPRIFRHPDLYHPPLYPFLLSLGFRAFPAAFAMERPGGVFVPEQWVIVPLNHLFLLLSGLVGFLLARHFFGSVRARWTIAIFLLSHQMWADSISGLGLTLVMFFLLSGFYLAVLASAALDAGRDRAAWLLAAGAALACGLAVLTRYAAAAAVPGILLYVALSFGRRRWMAPALFGLVVLLTLAPWMARNQRAGGSLFGLAPRAALHYTGLFDEDSIERRIHHDPPGIRFLPVLRTVSGKMLSRLGDFYGRRLFSFGEGLLFPFFVCSFFFRYIRRDVNRFRWCLAVSLLGIVLAGAVFNDSVYRLMNAFWPAVILYGLAFFFLLLDRLQLRLRVARLAVTLLVALLSVSPMVFALIPPHPGVPYPPYFPPYIMSVSSLLEPDEAMATDMPWATAWYGDRASVYLPRSLDEFFELNDYHHRLSAIYFTTLTRDRPFVRQLRTGPYQSWYPILEGRIPRDFPLVHGFPMHNLDQLFLTDRPRWAERP